jgi:hypothetical protein
VEDVPETIVGTKWISFWTPMWNVCR